MATGDRIKRARELRAQTQVDLASRVGVNQSAIAQFESNSARPAPDTLEAIAIQTGLPLSFFRQKSEPPEFPFGSLLFRAKKAMRARDRAQAHRYGEIVYEAAMRMAERAPPAAVRLPRTDGHDPSAAAVMARSALGISPDAPIRNLLNVIERGGVLVMAVPITIPNVDAYSVWAGGLKRPVIVLFAGAPGDRLRLSIAHELGHLVMHQAPSGDIEREAYAFAGSFLIPEAAMRSELSPPVTLSDLARMKAKWGVSMQAVAVNARNLGIINDRQLKYLYQQFSMRGWRKIEPTNLDVPVEKPRAFRKMAEVLYGDPIDVKRLAGDLVLSPTLIEDILHGYAGRAELPRAPEDLPRTDVADNVIAFPNRTDQSA